MYETIVQLASPPARNNHQTQIYRPHKDWAPAYPDQHPSPIECYCNPGLIWNSTKTECIDPKQGSPNNKISMFVGTWNGTGNAKGITMTINKDYTMTFSDTRPGYEKSGKGEWGLDPDRVNCIYSPINYSLWYQDGKLSDPWANIYIK